MSIEKSRDELFTSEKPLQVCMSLKYDVPVKFFANKYVEVGNEAVVMD